MKKVCVTKLNEGYVISEPSGFLSLGTKRYAKKDVFDVIEFLKKWSGD